MVDGKRQIEQLINQQLLPAGVEDHNVLEALRQVPRQFFVNTSLGSRAYDNKSLPIGLGQTISAPLTVAKGIQALQLAGTETVLEIGTGSGYQAAVLAQLCRRVYTVERLLPFIHRAKRVLSQLNIQNVIVRYGNGTDGWPRYAPFDAIICAATMQQIPQKLAAQLRPGGKLVTPVLNKQGKEHFLLLRRDNFGLRLERDLGQCNFVPFIKDN